MILRKITFRKTQDVVPGGELALHISTRSFCVSTYHSSRWVRLPTNGREKNAHLTEET